MICTARPPVREDVKHALYFLELPFLYQIYLRNLKRLRTKRLFCFFFQIFLRFIVQTTDVKS